MLDTERKLLNALRSAMNSKEFRAELALLLSSCASELAVEPAYTGPIAQKLIPCSEFQIGNAARKLNLPHRYRVFKEKTPQGLLPRKFRMFSAREIHAIRSSLEKTKKHPGFKSKSEQAHESDTL